MSHAIEQAGDAADRVRGELFRTLDELDRRRARALDLRHQAKENWPVLAGVGAVLGGLVIARVLVARLSARRERLRLREERRAALLRLWTHPERLAPARHSPLVEWGSRALTVTASAVASALARKAAKRLVG